MMSPASVYRIFRRPDGPAASVRVIVIALVVVAVLLTSVALIRVKRQHEVLRLGYQLSRTSDSVRKLSCDVRR